MRNPQPFSIHVVSVISSILLLPCTMRHAKPVPAKPVSCSSSGVLVPSCISCQRKSKISRRSERICCQAQGDGSNVASALCGVGVALLLANPAEAGLLSSQQYGSPTVANPRALVLDRQRVEKLLANEFKERLHDLTNDQLVQMLDELLESQQTTAPELFEDVLGRQLEAHQQQPQPQSDVGQQLASGVRQGLAKLWGFSQNRPEVRPAPANLDPAGGSTSTTAKESAATDATVGTASEPDTAQDEGGSSSDAKLPSASAPGAISSSRGVGADGGKIASTLSKASALDSEVAGQQGEKWISSDVQPKVPATAQMAQQEDDKLQQQQQQRRRRQSAGVEAADAGAAAAVGQTTKEMSSLKTTDIGTGTASANAPDADNRSLRFADVLSQQQQQQQQHSSDQPSSVENEGVYDDLGESDITGGLLFGGPGSGQDLFAPTDSTAAAQRATDTQNSSDPPSNGFTAAAAAAASKVQSLLQFPAKLLSKVSTEGSSSSPQAAAGDAAASSAPAGGAVAPAPAVGGAGGVLAGATAAAAAASSGLKDLLQAPGEVAESVDAAFEEWRYSAAEAVSGVLDEQGATIAAAFALTATAGGGVLLLSSLLQPLLDGELTKSSKLSAALQQQEGEGEAEQSTQETAGVSKSSSSSSGIGASAVVPERQPEAETAGGFAGAEAKEAFPLAKSQLEAINSSSSGNSMSPILSGLLDNVSSADVDITTALESTPAVGEDPFSAAAASGVNLRMGIPAATTTATSADGSPILWQRTEQAPLIPPLDSPLSAAAAAAAGGGVILWQRDSAPIPSTVAAAADSSSILWQQDSTSVSAPALPSNLATLEEAANSNSSSSSVLWQRPDLGPVQKRQAAPGQVNGTSIAGAADVGNAGADGSEWLWSASSMSMPPQQQQQPSAWGDSAASLAQPRSSSSRQRVRGKDRMLSQLLSNVEDVVEGLPAGSVLPQQPPWQQWQQWQPPPAWPQQQQPAAHAATATQQGSSSSASAPGGGDLSWQPSSSSSASYPHQTANHNDSISTTAPAGTPPRNPKDLWPVILATSSTAFSYSSMASADFAELDVSLVLPGDLPGDPWGTLPPGLQPSLEELRELGVLQSELQGLAQAAAACKDASAAESPWSRPAPTAASSGVNFASSGALDRSSDGGGSGTVVHEVAVEQGLSHDHLLTRTAAHEEAMSAAAGGDQVPDVRQLQETAAGVETVAGVVGSQIDTDVAAAGVVDGQAVDEQADDGSMTVIGYFQ